MKITADQIGEYLAKGYDVEMDDRDKTITVYENGTGRIYIIPDGRLN